MEQDLFGVARILQGDRASGSRPAVGRAARSARATHCCRRWRRQVVTDADTLAELPPDAVGVAVGADGESIGAVASVEQMPRPRPDGKRVVHRWGLFTGGTQGGLRRAVKLCSTWALREPPSSPGGTCSAWGLCGWQDTT